MKASNYKYDAILYRLNKGEKIYEMTSQDFATLVEYNIAPEDVYRLKRNGVKDLQKAVFSSTFNRIKLLHGVSDKDRLVQQYINTKNKLSRQRTRLLSKTIASNILRKVGNGVETATTGLDFAQGGVDTAAGVDMIQKARDLKARREIKDVDYNEMMRNGRLRIAQGSFGLASGMKNVAKFVTKRLERRSLTKAGEKLLKQAIRFGSFVGGAISVGTSVVSMTKNAIAASDAAEKGIVGKAIMYGVMAGVDGVTAILDGVSVALDFIFPPFSVIVDLISTVLQVVNTILGFFADLIDFRTPEQRVRDEFKTYINSGAFKKYVKNLADGYKSRGFDIFKYYVDAEVAGIEADKETLQAKRTNITKCLTDKAKEDFNNKQLRVALVDATSFGKTLKGRANDDEIVAGFGPDRIYGEEGDDVLFGRGGEDTIYGGPGNDYLNGGTGRDILLGGEGDDFAVCELGVDRLCAGQQGNDALALSAKALMFGGRDVEKHYIRMDKPWVKFPTSNGVTGVYVDMRRTLRFKPLDIKNLSIPLPYEGGQGGINLGSCFHGWPDGFNKFFHKPAFSSESDLWRRFKHLFLIKTTGYLKSPEELKSKVLWFLAKEYGVKYFCDGLSIYGVSTNLFSDSVKVATNAILKISHSHVFNSNGHLAYHGDYELEALLVSAFQSTFTDTFETMTASRSDYTWYDPYVPMTVIGSDDHNVIDLSFGLRDVVYTGKGNNVVSIGSSLSMLPFEIHGSFRSWAKYIVGGSGDNTLIIHFMPSPYNNSEWQAKWELRNMDQTVRPRWESSRTYIVFLENITTVEIRSPESRGQDTSIKATLYNGASRYILNHSNSFYGPLSSKRDVIVLPRRLLRNRYWDSYVIKFAKESKTTISFKYITKTRDI